MSISGEEVVRYVDAGTHLVNISVAEVVSDT